MRPADALAFPRGMGQRQIGTDSKEESPRRGLEPLGGGLHDFLTVGADDIHGFGCPDGVATARAGIFPGAGWLGVFGVFRRPCAVDGQLAVPMFPCTEGAEGFGGLGN